MKSEYDVVIGIDPDVDKNGVAYLVVDSKTLFVHKLTLPELMEFLTFSKGMLEKSGQKLLVCVEAGWLNKSNWHLPPGASARKAAAMGEAVGRNQQIGHDIVDLCRAMNIEVEEVKPLRKCWKGKDGKITTAELENITGQKLGRINQEVRDAILIAWTKAELPIVLK